MNWRISRRRLPAEQAAQLQAIRPRRQGHASA